jgi:rhodanese-related sulfurtransferase
MPAFRQQPIDLVLDVRSPMEFLVGSLPGAENVPVDQLPGALEARTDVAKDARILVFCAAGARSAAAAAALRRAGYTAVVDGGGINAAHAEYAADHA